jgi:hypothetical protein
VLLKIQTHAATKGEKNRSLGLRIKEVEKEKEWNWLN